MENSRFMIPVYTLQVVVDMLGDAAQAAPICRYSQCSSKVKDR